MSYADKPLCENPYWNATYHVRFAYEYLHTAYVLDGARQSADHYRWMAVQELKAAAGHLGFDLTPKTDKRIVTIENEVAA